MVCAKLSEKKQSSSDCSRRNRPETMAICLAIESKLESARAWKAELID